VFVKETGYGSQASRSHHRKVGDEVSALEWPGAVFATFSMKQRLFDKGWGTLALLVKVGEFMEDWRTHIL
jgi:hypothetical protein